MPRYNSSDATEVAGALIPAGTYEAVVKRAENKISKAERERAKQEGREPVENMIALILTCYHAGDDSDVFDYLVFDPKTLYKVRHFCDSAGLDFEKGELDAAECTDRNVLVRVVVKDDPTYGKQNQVKDYLIRTSNTGAPVSVVKVNRDPLDSDIPFSVER
jgi:hypothetical protein